MKFFNKYALIGLLFFTFLGGTTAVTFDLLQLQSGLERPTEVDISDADRKNENQTSPEHISQYDQLSAQVTEQIEISLAMRESPTAIGNILLIHGAASGAWAWEYFFEQLPENYNLYAINWRGHYASSNVNNAFASDYVFDQEAALKELIKRNSLPTHLIGHSYGGATAVLQAAQTRHKISSLTLLAPVVPLKYTTIQRHIIPRLAPYFIKKDQAKGNDPDGLFGNMFLSKKRMKYYYDNYASHDHAKEKPGLIAGDGVSEVWQKKLRSAYEIVSEQKIPTLILSARYDNVVVPVRQAEIARTIGAQYKELQSGHYIPLDVEAENAAKLVTKFLQSIPRQNK